MTPMTIPDAAVEAATTELSRIIGEWERNREFLNVSPEIKQEFIHRQASSLTAAIPHLGWHVKELSWRQEENGDLIAESAVGWYHIGLPHRTWNLTTPQGEVLSFWNLEEAKSAAQADFTRRASSMLEAGEKGPQAEFGHGRLCIDTGTYKSIPAVFVRPAKIGGQVGEKCPEAEHHPLDSLAPGEWFMTFPTDEQSQAVADALCGFLSVPDARTATLEEAARAAEGESPNFDHQEALAECRDCESGFHRGRLAATAAIRALSGSAPAIATFPKLERSIDQWHGMKPSSVMKGSPAQIAYALEDARKDILALARTLSGSGDGWLPLTDGLNAIGYEICGRHVLKLSYENLNQLEAAKEAIQSLLPSAPSDGGENNG